MLRPRKNPLIDGTVIVSDRRRLRRWQWSTVALAGALLALVAAWPSPQSQSHAVPDEIWWRRLISTIAFQRLTRDVDASAAGEMKQRLAQLEAERLSLTERLAEADRLLRIDRSQQRLNQVVAQRKGNEITFEILLRTPPGSGAGTRLTLDVIAIQEPALPRVGRRMTDLVLQVDRATRLMVNSPKVAETLQGRLPSSASHLLVMLAPGGDTSRAEALLVPVNGSH